MSENKHTPGPWFVYPQHPDRFTIGDYNGGSGPCRVVADCAPRACITGAGDHTKGEAESEANARLIAAAPELLALLEELIDVEGPQPGTSAWADKARAIVAQVKGGAA